MQTLGTLTIGQAPRPDVTPIIDRHVPAEVRRIHRGVLDGMTLSDVEAQYRPEPGEAALVTRLHDGSGTFDGLECRNAWLIEPDHIIPATVAGLVEHRQLGILVPIAVQITSESGKWRALAKSPLFGVASPYSDPPEAVSEAGAALKAQGAAAILLDCIGFTERHRAALAPVGLPVILSNAVVAKAVGELFGG